MDKENSRDAAAGTRDSSESRDVSRASSVDREADEDGEEEDEGEALLCLVVPPLATLGKTRCKVLCSFCKC